MSDQADCFKNSETKICTSYVAWYPDISVKDTLVMDVLVTDISVTGHFGHRIFRSQDISVTEHFGNWTFW